MRGPWVQCSVLTPAPQKDKLCFNNYNLTVKPRCLACGGCLTRCKRWIPICELNQCFQRPNRVGCAGRGSCVRFLNREMCPWKTRLPVVRAEAAKGRKWSWGDGGKAVAAELRVPREGRSGENRRRRPVAELAGAGRRCAPGSGSTASRASRPAQRGRDRRDCGRDPERAGRLRSRCAAGGRGLRLRAVWTAAGRGSEGEDGAGGGRRPARKARKARAVRAAGRVQEQTGSSEGSPSPLDTPARGGPALRRGCALACGRRVVSAFPRLTVSGTRLVLYSVLHDIGEKIQLPTC